MSPPGKYDPGGARTTVYLNMSLVCSVRTLEGAGSDSRSHMIHLQAGNRFRTVKGDQVTHLGFGLSFTSLVAQLVKNPSAVQETLV